MGTQSAARDSEGAMYSAVKSQKAVSAYFTSEQILPIGFAELYWTLYREQHNWIHDDLCNSDKPLRSLSFDTALDGRW